jgi:hypothetical protein
MSETYKIVNFADILRVPAERRDDCLRDLQYGLSLLELAFEPDEAYIHGVQGFTWIDDGDRRVDLMQEGGGSFLTLQITEAAAPMQEQGEKP